MKGRAEGGQEAEEEAEQGIKELLSVLIEGLAVKVRSLRTPARDYVERLFWFDVDEARLCVDKSKPSLADRYKRAVVPIGVYLMDVSCFRPVEDDALHHGADEQHASLEIVGTENAFEIVLPTSSTRDWLLKRLWLLLVSACGEKEIESRGRIYRAATQRSTATEAGRAAPSASSHNSDSEGDGEDESTNNDDDDDSGAPLEQKLGKRLEITRGLLKTGLRVVLHSRGCTHQAVLSLEENGAAASASSLRVTLLDNGPLSRGLSSFQWILRLFVGTQQALSGGSGPPLPLPLRSIAEIRVGSHTRDFVSTRSEATSQATGMCIVGGEAALSLELASRKARDVLASRLVEYIALHSEFLS